jgi:hypothetical protein
MVEEVSRMIVVGKQVEEVAHETASDCVMPVCKQISPRKRPWTVIVVTTITTKVFAGKSLHSASLHHLVKACASQTRICTTDGRDTPRLTNHRKGLMYWSDQGSDRVLVGELSNDRKITRTSSGIITHHGVPESDNSLLSYL